MKIKDSTTTNFFDIDKEQRISIYNCGPTVYNDVHIGNIRPVVAVDVLLRYLRYKNLNFLYVHNITDIDDKIISKAKEENQSEKQITKTYFKRYKNLLKGLNVLKPQMPHVSKNIKEIIHFIEELIRLDFAYEKNGDVFFNVSKIKQYGQISHQNIDDLISGSRVENSANKKNSLDFTLWKKTTDGKNWESKWSKGRPGWHTECVCLINKFVGSQLTIHAGGMDLKFPHHENENAQNIAMNNIPLAKAWMHVGHVTINDEKMAKSRNNFILAKDLLEKNSANAIKWFFFQTQYHNPLKFSAELFDQANVDCQKIQRLINTATLYLSHNKINFKKYGETELSEIVESEFENNLNTPNIVTHIWEKTKSIPGLISKKDYVNLSKNLCELKIIFSILGLKFCFYPPCCQKLFYGKWQKAVLCKNYYLADKFRKKLSI